jgi:hypothetical protein
MTRQLEETTPRVGREFFTQGRRLLGICFWREGHEAALGPERRDC